MKKLLNVFIVVIMMVMFGFQSNALAGTDTNICFIAEYNDNFDLNGTNCTMLKVVYPKAWPTWYVITSTNLSVGGWYFKLGSEIKRDSYLGLPRSRTFYLKNDTNNITTQIFWAVSTNKTEFVEI